MFSETGALNITVGVNVRPAKLALAGKRAGKDIKGRAGCQQRGVLARPRA